MAFLGDQLTVNVGGYEVQFSSLTQEQQSAIQAITLPFIIYENITKKTEIDIYMQLNSGLPFSVGKYAHDS